MNIPVPLLLISNSEAANLVPGSDISEVLRVTFEAVWKAMKDHTHIKMDSPCVISSRPHSNIALKVIPQFLSIDLMVGL